MCMGFMGGWAGLGLSGYFASCPPACGLLLVRRKITGQPQPLFIALRRKITGQPHPLFMALRRSKGQGVSAVAQ